MTSTDPAPVKSRPSLWRRALLPASLALNIAVVSAAATFAATGVRPHRPGPPERRIEQSQRLGLGAGGFDMGALLRALPPERRAEIRRSVRDQLADARPDDQARRVARREAFAALFADPFDAAAARGAFERLRVADDQAAVFNHDVAVAISAALTPDERKLLRENLEKARGQVANRIRDRVRDRFRGADGETPPIPPPAAESPPVE